MRFLQYSQRMVRENFSMNISMRQLCAMTPAEEAFSARFSQFITVNNAERIVAHLNDAAADIAANSQAKIVLFDMAVEIIILIRRC